MIAEALQHLEEMAVQADELKIVNLREQGGPPELLIIGKDGKEQKIPLRKDRTHQLANLDDLCALTKRIAKSGTVWHDEEAIRVCFNDEDRVDTGAMRLTRDSRFQAVLDIAKGTKPLNHDQFMRLLRSKFDGALSEGTVQTFEKLKFDTNSESEAAIQRQSIAKSAIAKAVGVSEIPKDIRVSTPVYSEAQVTGQPVSVIRCLVEINAAEQSFLISPIQRDIELAQMAADRHINDQLHQRLDASVNVSGIYQGRP